MSKGYPDFFGQSIFLKYGIYNIESDFAIVVAGTRPTIVEVEAKGLLQGGFIYTNDVDALSSDNPYLYIDGVDIIEKTWSGMFNANFGNNPYTPVVLMSYDVDTPAYGLFFQNQIPFETSLTIKYKKVLGGNVLVTGALYYQELI